MGKFNGLSLGSIIGAVIMLVIAFSALTSTIPTLNDALGNLTWVDNGSGTLVSTGIPFVSLFGSNGIVVLALMGAVILGVVAYLGFTGSKK
jgi:hypothetical protein